jgi:hypothetical protein
MCFAPAFMSDTPRIEGRQAWHLLVWDLEGAPATWQSQLKLKYTQNPIFALVSGLGTDEWAPVHQFCEAEKIPCLFPNIDAPASRTEGHYSFYFSKGVVVEAQVAAHYLAGKASALGLERVIQLHRGSGAGTRAAEALRGAVETRLQVEDRIFSGTDVTTFRSAVSGLGNSDVLVAWLDHADLRALTTVDPPAAGMILLSGWLGGWENMPLPTAWKRVSLIAYPIDAPKRRSARMEFNLRPWLIGKSIAAADELLLGNTLTACNLLYEGVLRLRGTFFRDYLVELTENYPAGMGNAPAPQAYPRFSLGPGQRFSSKGAYIVRFKSPELTELELVQDWTVPQ